MTDGRTYTLTGVNYGEDYVGFFIDNDFVLKSGNIHYRGESNNDFGTSRCYPFTTWQVGDQIEIDIEGLENSGVEFIDNYVRMKQRAQQNNSIIVPVNQQTTSNQIQTVGNQMRQGVEQSGGQYETEFMAREEYRDNGSVSARQMGGVYRKKS